MIEKISLPLFGRLLEGYLEHFEGMRRNLRRANMEIAPLVYLSNMVFLSLLTFCVVLFSSLVSFSFLVTATVYVLSFSVILSAGVAFLVALLLYTYPSVRLRSLQSHIDRSLPFAILYLSTSASAGISPVQMFKMLSTKGGVIGEEAKKIYRSVTAFGMDLPTVLQKTAEHTPSHAFADVLWGMISIITTGGSMDAYLRSKTRHLMNAYKRSLKDYSRQVSLYTEIYITLIVIGSLFFIILIALISPFIGLSVLFLQGFLVFFVIPFVSAAYLVLLKGLNPEE